MSAKEEVTELVVFGDIDGEALPLVQCVCGHGFAHWDFVLGYCGEHQKPCPACGRKFCFTNTITVYQNNDVSGD